MLSPTKLLSVRYTVALVQFHCVMDILMEPVRIKVEDEIDPAHNWLCFCDHVCSMAAFIVVEIADAGSANGKSVDWMDAKGEEIALWQAMLDRPNCWIEGTLLLRLHMGQRK